MFNGYFQNKELTNEKIVDGWYETGDVVTFNDQNLGFKIVGSIENLIKLGDGVFVSANKLENIYIKVKYVWQICVIGINQKIVAVVVPSKKKVLDFLIYNKIIENSENLVKLDNIDNINIDSYLSNKELISEISKEFEIVHNTDRSLTKHEKIENIYLSASNFSFQNGLIDGKGRINRKKIERYYLDNKTN